MDRLSIRSRLFLLCTALVALTAFVGGLGAWGLARMDEAFQGTIRRDVPSDKSSQLCWLSLKLAIMI